MRLRMRALVLVISIASATAHAGPPSDVGPYVSWTLTGWLPRDKLAATLGKNEENGAQFALVLGMRVHHLALEAWRSPEMQSGVDVQGVDVKAILPIGRYFSTYGRLRYARMTVDVDPNSTRDAPLVGNGGGAAAGIQVQFPGRTFGLLIPAWFGAPFGWRGTGGVYLEFGSESYALGPRGSPPERFWRYAYGVAWGAAF
jgi:hypothetical protein